MFNIERSGEMKGYKKFRKWYVLHEDVIEFLLKKDKKILRKKKRLFRIGIAFFNSVVLSYIDA
jgi:hypothetical protein